jgi:hypothetical protein
MSTNDLLLRKADRMAGQRRLMLLLNGATYTAWMVGLAVTTGTSAWQDTPVWGYLRTAGMIGWILSLLGVGWTMLQARRHRQITALIDDERTKSVTAWAFGVGYVLLLFPLAGIYTASYFMPVGIHFVIPIMLAIGVVAPTATYAVLFRH